MIYSSFSAKCTDAYGKSRCEYYRTMGWCQSHPTMRIHCKNTCVCNNKPVSKLRSKPCSATKYGCCWDRKTTKESKDGKGCPSKFDNQQLNITLYNFRYMILKTLAHLQTHKFQPVYTDRSSKYRLEKMFRVSSNWSDIVLTNDFCQGYQHTIKLSYFL